MPPRRTEVGHFAVVSIVVAVLAVLSVPRVLVNAPLASASQAPNLIGAYSVHVICTSCGGTRFTHSWQIASEDRSTGTFSGTGKTTYGAEKITETLIGTVAGNSVRITSTYKTPIYTWQPRGKLASNCSMSGSFTDSLHQSGTWQANPRRSGHC